MTTINIGVSDLEAKDLLKQLQAKAKAPGSAMRQIAGIMHRAVEKNFEAQGRPTPWLPLALSTQKQRAREGHWPGKILQVHGQLVGSITRRYTATEAVVGTNKEYALIHQLGGTVQHPPSTAKVFFKKHRRGKHKGHTLFSKESKASYGMSVQKQGYSITIPARPFMTLVAEELAKCKAVLLKFILGGQKGGG